MEEITNLRIRCAMVVYEFERSLAKYVKARSNEIHSTSQGQEILDRNRSSNLNDPKTRDINFILENSYLAEVFQLAETSARDSNNYEHFKRLSTLCNAIELFDIRNAISHPNRPFPECYWFRCCALASDPTISQLGMQSVIESWQKAISGNLDSPPEEWLNTSRFIVPTTLPSTFEHSTTGLIGRRKDSEKLLKELKDQRSFLISVVARGGIGKTSLVLQVLSDFCLSTESTKFVDGVVFISLKQEALTANGIEELNAPQSIAELKDMLSDRLNDLYGEECERFEDSINSYAEKRTWLFIDNLETLLRDNPLEFLSFYDELPQSWKVIVTSRIPLDGAKNMTLLALDEGGAISLANTYILSKGVESPEIETIRRLVKACDNNPLAVRLVIDRFVSGYDIDLSIQITNQDVLAFSFTNLLDVLSDQANDVLEALFVLDETPRGKLCDALNLDVDEIATVIAELSRTSLILRRETDSGELYSLGASIKDLLRASPRNLKIRNAIIDWSAKSYAKINEAMIQQKGRGTLPIDAFYIPLDTSASCIAIAKEVQKACRTQKNDVRVLSDLDNRVQQHMANQGATSFLHRIRARLLIELGDPSDAEKSLRTALKLDPDDISAKNALASILLKAQKTEESEALTEELIKDGWGDKAKSGNECEAIWSKYLQALNWQDKLDDVFSKTENWKESGDLFTVFATARAQAYRRKAVHAARTPQNEQTVWKLICHGLTTIDSVLRKSGTNHGISQELRKQIGDITHYCKKNNFEIPTDEHAKTIAAFISTYSQMIRSLCPEEIKVIVQNIPLLRGTDSSQSDQIHSTSSISRRIQEMAAKGFKIVMIHNVPKHDIFPNYLFAHDSDDARFYMSQNNFENGNRKKWVGLKKGSKIAIKYLPLSNGRAATVTDAWSVE